MVASTKQLISALIILISVATFFLLKVPLFDLSSIDSLTHLTTNGFHPWLAVNLPPIVELYWLSAMLFVAAALCFGPNIEGIAKATVLTVLTLALFGGERLMLRSMLTVVVAVYLLQHSRDKRLILLITLFAIWFILGGSSYSTFNYPSFPSGARVVPDDGIAGLIRPLLGPDADIQIIDRGALREHYAPLSLIALLIAIYPVIRGQFVGFAFALIALLDTSLPEYYAQMAPLQAFSRLVPYLLYSPIIASVIGISLIFSIRAVSNLIFLLLLAIYGLVISTNNFPCNLSTKASQICSLQNVSKYLLSTPSAGIALSTPKDILSRYYDLQLNKLVIEPPDFIPFRGSERLLDNKNDSRLRLNSKELRIEFINEQSLAGIVLNPGSYYSDFPRAFEVREIDTQKLLYKTDNWQGALRFEEKLGLPYYGSEQDVTILFPEVVKTKGITVISDSEKQKPYDWSVAEFRIIKAR